MTELADWDGLSKRERSFFTTETDDAPPLSVSAALPVGLTLGISAMTQWGGGGHYHLSSIHEIFNLPPKMRN